MKPHQETYEEEFHDFMTYIMFIQVDGGHDKNNQLITNQADLV